MTHISRMWNCVVSVVYGECDYEKRQDLWADLISSGSIFDDSMWLVLGDFNAIHSPIEHCGGSMAWPTWKDDLGCCLGQAGLDDLQFSGCQFTWFNKQIQSLIWRKLDRVLVNSSWECLFPGSSARFLPPRISNHSHMVVKLAELPKRKIPFKFFDFWVDHPDFLSVVARAWDIDIHSTLMFCLYCKLKSVK